MFNKNKKNSNFRESFDTLIGSCTTFEGNINSEGTVRVDGRVKGDLNVKGDVFVGSEGMITGNIYANNVHISGTVEGNVVSSGLLRLLSAARLYGDIQVHTFVTDEGAIFQGHCSMTDVPAADKAIGRHNGKKSNKDYKKSAVLDQAYEEKDAELKDG